MSTASVDMSTPGQLSEDSFRDVIGSSYGIVGWSDVANLQQEPRVPLKQKVDTFFQNVARS